MAHAPHICHPPRLLTALAKLCRLGDERENGEHESIDESDASGK
jgi:hypothetical protein